MQATRENTRWLTEDKHARYLLPVLGNQPRLHAALDALPWESTPVTAVTSEISHGRIETRTIRVLPAAVTVAANLPRPPLHLGARIRNPASRSWELSAASAEPGAHSRFRCLLGRTSNPPG
jgi:hypothetical protein